MYVCKDEIKHLRKNTKRIKSKTSGYGKHNKPCG